MTGEGSAGKKKLKRLLTPGSAPRSHVKHYAVPERHVILGALCAVVQTQQQHWTQVIRYSIEEPP
jgi:hypothetical protein